MNWALSDIEKLAAAGRIKGYKLMDKPVIEHSSASGKKKAVKLPKPVPVGLQFIKQESAFFVFLNCLKNFDSCPPRHSSHFAIALSSRLGINL